MAQRLKRLPPMQETRVRSLGWEDPLEKAMAIHSSILAWRIPWTERPSGLQSTVLQRVRQDGAQHGTAKQRGRTSQFMQKGEPAGRKGARNEGLCQWRALPGPFPLN